MASPSPERYTDFSIPGGDETAHTLPLSEMSIEEKLQMMEALWDDLSRNTPALASPQWHGQVLAEREAALDRDEDSFEDWQQARERIERETH